MPPALPGVDSAALCSLLDVAEMPRLSPDPSGVALVLDALEPARSRGVALLLPGVNPPPPPAPVRTGDANPPPTLDDDDDAAAAAVAATASAGGGGGASPKLPDRCRRKLAGRGSPVPAPSPGPPMAAGVARGGV